MLSQIYYQKQRIFSQVYIYTQWLSIFVYFLNFLQVVMLFCMQCTSFLVDALLKETLISWPQINCSWPQFNSNTFFISMNHSFFRGKGAQKRRDPPKRGVCQWVAPPVENKIYFCHPKWPGSGLPNYTKTYRYVFSSSINDVANIPTRYPRLPQTKIAKKQILDTNCWWISLSRVPTSTFWCEKSFSA